jgi:tetratricopeptide (TPR) repeat protein
MTQDDKPRLALDPVPGTKGGGRGRLSVTLVLAVVALLQGAVLLRLHHAPAPEAPGRPDPDAVRELATTLEQRSLPREAAREWERYLELAPGDPESAQILYRAGSLRLEAGDPAEAVRDFIAAEQEAKRRNVTLPPQLATKIVDAMRALGLYGEVGRELTRRTVPADAKVPAGRVVATYAGESITAADLDRMIEQRVDERMRLEGVRDEAKRAELLKGLNTPEMRRQILQDILRVELMARRARDLNLDKEEDFRATLRRAGNELLAARFVHRELSSIRATEVDLRSYYEANKETFRKPEAEATPSFEEARDEVLQAYVGIKQKELTASLTRDLMTRYDVKILEEKKE